MVVALYGDYATPSETESTMLMFIIGMSLLFSYVMSYLHISQSAAQGIVGCTCPNGCCWRRS